MKSDRSGPTRDMQTLFDVIARAPTSRSKEALLSTYQRKGAEGVMRLMCSVLVPSVDCDALLVEAVRQCPRTQPRGALLMETIGNARLWNFESQHPVRALRMFFKDDWADNASEADEEEYRQTWRFLADRNDVFGDSHDATVGRHRCTRRFVLKCALGGFGFVALDKEGQKCRNGISVYNGNIASWEIKQYQRAKRTRELDEARATRDLFCRQAEKELGAGDKNAIRRLRDFQNAVDYHTNDLQKLNNEIADLQAAQPELQDIILLSGLTAAAGGAVAGHSMYQIVSSEVREAQLRAQLRRVWKKRVSALRRGLSDEDHQRAGGILTSRFDGGKSEDAAARELYDSFALFAEPVLTANGWYGTARARTQKSLKVNEQFLENLDVPKVAEGMYYYFLTRQGVALDDDPLRELEKKKTMYAALVRMTAMKEIARTEELETVVGNLSQQIGQRLVCLAAHKEYALPDARETAQGICWRTLDEAEIPLSENAQEALIRKHAMHAAVARIDALAQMARDFPTLGPLVKQTLQPIEHDAELLAAQFRHRLSQQRPSQEYGR